MEIRTVRKTLTIVLLALSLMMLFVYQTGYDYSLDWKTTTIGEVIEFPAMQVSGALMDHQISGERYLLKEEYSGGPIERTLWLDQVLLGTLWLGLCILLAASTKLKRIGFFIVMALLSLFINRLNLFEVGLFGIHSRMILIIPFILLMAPLVVFHEYRQNVPFIFKVIILASISALILLGVSDATLFTDHMIAHSLFGWTLMAIIFLLLISEEIVFGILYVVTSTKGGKSNHVHFLILSLMYLGNLGLYYLNKSGLFENSFFLFDPFLLLFISTIVSLWSMKFKARALADYLSENTLYLVMLGLGIITFTFLTQHMLRGNDGIYQAFDYLVLYFHLGVGAFFFLYSIANFIDPLIEGYEVHKIIYRERNLPYASARFFGLIAVIAFYLSGAQEPYNLLKGGYYNYMAQIAKEEKNYLLEKEYYLQAGFLGFNTHYANYQLARKALGRGEMFDAKMLYYKASQRFPSPYSLVNYGNLEREVNPNKVKAVYEEALRKTPSGEVENNLGLILLEKEDYPAAVHFFENAKPSDSWNNAPVLNKWYALSKQGIYDSVSIKEDYLLPNYGVKANILLGLPSPKDLGLNTDFKALPSAPFAHRRAYLLNALHVFEDDSLISIAREELQRSKDLGYNQKLQLALALNFYRRGMVNDAFTTLDYLIANAPTYESGRYLAILAKLALEQGASSLSIDYFDRAIEANHNESRISRLDALAQAGRGGEIPGEMLKILKENPELTATANTLLAQLENYSVQKKQERVPSHVRLDSLSDEALVALGEMNAFNTNQVISVADELKKRKASGEYPLLLYSIEINPYSEELLKRYCLTALEWNLFEYADQGLRKLENLIEAEEFQKFSSRYNSRKEELEKSDW